ncbi:RRXRR domain-containing protein [Coleofasciculus sp. A1-SPW-01]|uniref:RRXRR domain-containing protein n=1 Tax=Coleofasciculus sp. A1-SPW-01 TaxID=3070819 RepID=UPI0040646E8F
MPAKASRVRRWLKAGKAKVVHNDLGIFQVQLVEEPSGKKTQDILTGIDPGKLFTGVAVQSKGGTLFLAHLNLPFKTVTKLRRNYGGTISRHGFRKGDYVKAVKAGITYYGYVSGNTKTEVSVSNANWKRIGRFTTSKVQLLQRNTGLISTVGLSNLTTLNFDRLNCREVEVSGAV